MNFKVSAPNSDNPRPFTNLSLSFIQRTDPFFLPTRCNFAPIKLIPVTFQQSQCAFHTKASPRAYSVQHCKAIIYHNHDAQHVPHSLQALEHQ